MRTKMTFLLISAFILPLLLSACGSAAPGPCDFDKVEAANKQLVDIGRNWEIAYNLASNTSIAELAAPVKTMQSIKRDVDALEVPACLTTARGYFSEHIRYTIEGLQAAMAQKPDSTVHDLISRANALLTKYVDEMGRVVACAPNCN